MSKFRLAQARTPIWNQPNEKIVRSTLGPLTTSAPASGLAVCLYMGRATAEITVSSVSAAVTGAGSGAQTAEVGIFSTPAAPDYTAQTLTKIGAVSVTGVITTTGNKTLASAMNIVVPIDTHWWVVFRQANATTQATFSAVGGDCGVGQVLSKTAAGVLTSISSITSPTIPTTVSGGLCPNLVVQLA